MADFPHDSDDDCYLDSEAVKQERLKQRKRKKAKLRKSGFDDRELSAEYSLKMNERYWTLAEEQLKHVWVDSSPNIPELKYLESLDELNLPPKVLRALQVLEVSRPTPVQQVVIPYVTQTKADIMVQAQTGSGKTLAFLLPIINQILEAKAHIRDYSPNNNAPYAIVVAPTRELAFQLARDATQLVQGIGNLRTAFGIGDVCSKDSRESLAKGCDILVLTPGRLFQYFYPKESYQAPMCKTTNLKWLVLDEADKFFDDHYKNLYQQDDENTLPQMRKIVYEFIMDLTKQKPDFRLMLFSATLDNPYLDELVSTNNWVKINVGSNVHTSTIKQRFIEVKNPNGKQEHLVTLIDCLIEKRAAEKENRPGDQDGRVLEPTIIFVNSKRQSDRLAHLLMGDGSKKLRVKSVNADRNGLQRYNAVRELIEGELDILVSTDILARGLNVRDLRYIINYDVPKKIAFKEYIHRIGRCGRVGHFGFCYTLFVPSEDYAVAQSLIECCEATSQDVPEFLRETLGHPENRRANYGWRNNGAHSDKQGGSDDSTSSLRSNDSGFFSSSRASMPRYGNAMFRQS